MRGKNQSRTKRETPSGSTELTVEVLRTGGSFIVCPDRLVEENMPRSFPGEEWPLL